MSLQNLKKGTERVQTKLGKRHVDYWHPRLRKRWYAGRDGVVHEVPDFQARIKHPGRSAWFNLKTSDRTDAALKARDIYIFLIANGWEAALNKFKPQAEKPQNLTVNEFVDVYRKIELVEYYLKSHRVSICVGRSFSLAARVVSACRPQHAKNNALRTILTETLFVQNPVHGIFSVSDSHSIFR